MAVAVTTSDVRATIGDRLIGITGGMHVSNFHGNGIPVGVITRHCNTSMHRSILNSLVDHGFVSTVVGRGVGPTNTPACIPNRCGLNRSFACSMRFRICPRIRLRNLRTVRIRGPVIRIASTSISNVLSALHGRRTA